MASPNRVSNHKYEFSNSGTLYSFDPNRMIYDNSNGGTKKSWLDLHLELVRSANRSDVFVVDSRGFIVDPNTGLSTQTTYHKPRANHRNNGKRGDARKSR